MKHQKKFLLLLAIIFSHCATKAQSIAPSTINSAGISFTNSNMQTDVNIGEMTLVSTVTNPNLIVTQGLFQPDESIPDNISENYFLQQQMNVYPNPTSNEINIMSLLEEGGTFAIRLADMQGKITLDEKMPVYVGENNIKLSLDELAQGNYMLMVSYTSGNDKILGSQNFKIQKIK